MLAEKYMMIILLLTVLISVYEICMQMYGINCARMQDRPLRRHDKPLSILLQSICYSVLVFIGSSLISNSEWGFLIASSYLVSKIAFSTFVMLRYNQ